jgi:broad specificity phosphatase PhoE
MSTETRRAFVAGSATAIASLAVLRHIWSWWRSNRSLPSSTTTTTSDGDGDGDGDDVKAGNLVRQRSSLKDMALTQPGANLNLLLIRHAQSFNNVVLKNLMKRFGMLRLDRFNPDFEQAYHQGRVADPPLSDLGVAQVDALMQHEYLRRIGIHDLAQAGRLRIFSSPLHRTLQTSDALAKGLGLKVEVIPFLAEHGGLFDTDENGVQHVRHGKSRAQLEKEWPRHDFSMCGEDGWWYTNSAGYEESEEFAARIERIAGWLSDIAWKHRHHHRSVMADDADIGAEDSKLDNSESPDVVIIVGHADLFNSMVTRMLHVPNRDYSFYFRNTSVTHMDLNFKANEDVKPADEDGDDGDDGDDDNQVEEHREDPEQPPSNMYLHCRVHTLNAAPVALHTDKT